MIVPLMHPPHPLLLVTSSLILLLQVSTSSDSVDDNFVWNFPIDVTFK